MSPYVEYASGHSAVRALSYQLMDLVKPFAAVGLREDCVSVSMRKWHLSGRIYRDASSDWIIHASDTFVEAKCPELPPFGAPLAGSDNLKDNDMKKTWIHLATVGIIVALRPLKARNKIENDLSCRPLIDTPQRITKTAMNNHWLRDTRYNNLTQCRALGDGR